MPAVVLTSQTWHVLGMQGPLIAEYNSLRMFKGARGSGTPDPAVAAGTATGEVVAPTLPGPGSVAALCRISIAFKSEAGGEFLNRA